MTPEGRVKKMINSYLDDLDEALDRIGQKMHRQMFVPTGYGKRNTLDFTICLRGHFVSIEAKAPDEDLTPNQRITARDLWQSGATVFVISNGEGMEAFKRWVTRNATWIFAT